MSKDFPRRIKQHGIRNEKSDQTKRDPEADRRSFSFALHAADYTTAYWRDGVDRLRPVLRPPPGSRVVDPARPVVSLRSTTVYALRTLPGSFWSGIAIDENVVLWNPFPL
jgi:hypothetical protein